MVACTTLPLFLAQLWNTMVLYTNYRKTNKLAQDSFALNINNVPSYLIDRNALKKRLEISITLFRGCLVNTAIMGVCCALNFARLVQPENTTGDTRRHYCTIGAAYLQTAWCISEHLISLPVQL